MGYGFGGGDYFVSSAFIIFLILVLLVFGTGGFGFGGGYYGEKK